MVDRRASLLRGPGEEAHRVSFFELFFDLVYVFAVTQLSHGLLEHLGLRGAGETLLLLLAVWWAWVYTTWATNWVDPDRAPVRLMLVGVMGAGLVMATALPEAFGDRGLVFALAYAAIQVGRSTFVLWAVRDDRVRRENFQRIVVWNAAASAIWIAGGLIESGGPRETAWVLALLVDYAAPWLRYRVPGLGAAHVSDWTVTGSYFAERFKLFIILSLGESILVTGITFSELEADGATVAAFALAFVGSVALWWIYFHRSAAAGEGAMNRAAEPGRIARAAYTYLHLPIVAGIIVTAVADELVIAHPTGHAEVATVLTTLGGPALFLAGHALYRWAVSGSVPFERLVAVAALIVLAVAGSGLEPLALAAVATGVVLAVALAETIREAPGVESDDEVRLVEP